LPANCLTVAFILANFASHLHTFLMPGICFEPALRPVKLAALCVLYMFCSQCLRPRRLAAFGHLYIFEPGSGRRTLIRAKKWGPKPPG
jgi:hypothetical protein